jgi:hypothetical protein
MFNLSKIKKQILSVVVLESIVLTGMAATPSYAHKSKAEKAATQQMLKEQSTPEKLALMEGSVTVHEGQTVEAETPAIKPPMSLKEVEKYNFDFGSGFASGSI